MILRALASALALSLCFVGPPSRAAFLSHYTSNEGREIVILEGTIAAGDVDQLISIAREVNARGISISGMRLNSPGGLLVEGVGLAAAVKAGGIATVVARGTICASACFIAFAGGNQKYVSYGARVGVHGASVGSATGMTDSPGGTVAMAKIVKELGVPPAIIGQMVVTSPDDMVWLSPTDLQSMGVEMTGAPGESAEASPSSGNVSGHARADPATLRRAVAPLVRALSDCVARVTLQDESAVAEYKAGTLGSYVVRAMDRCPGFVSGLVEVYDRMDGAGQGFAFLNGPYAADLPRAVLKRIKPQLDARLAAYGRELADRAAREEQDRQAAEERRKAGEVARIDQAKKDEAERLATIAVAQQKAAEAQVATAKAEAEAKAIAVKIEVDRQQHIAEAKQAEALLVDKAGECARRQLLGLVKSGESAGVLASAVMTICGAEVAALLDGGVQEFRLEHVTPLAEEDNAVFREKLRGTAREQIIALAVQAKAGVGTFAPARVDTGP